MNTTIFNFKIFFSAILFSTMSCNLVYGQFNFYNPYPYYPNQHELGTCQITCTMCNGSGRSPWFYNLECSTCNGTGKSICPTCRARKYGEAIGLAVCKRLYDTPIENMKSGINFMQLQEYDKALEHFDRSVDQGGYTSAFYIGIMYETGMGTLNRPLAKKWYEYGSSKGDQSCAIRLKNIQKEGFYAATAETRQKLSNLFKENIDNLQRIADIMTWQIVNGTSLESDLSFSSSTSTGRKKCTACNGTGKSADRITYSTNYTGHDNSRYCSTCGRVMDAHTHHQPMCRTCNGKGYLE